MRLDVKTKVQAIRITEYGGTEVMKFSDFELPSLVAGEARVQIHAAGVNFVDIYERRGTYRDNVALPYTPGREGAGVVVAIGDGVTNVKVGDRVAYCFGNGSYAQAKNVPANRLILLPDELTFEQGAAFPLQGMTAHYLLHDFHRLQPGETVLVHAAAGGMGLLLVQWAARQFGARVIGTVSTEKKAKVAREAGAHDVIIYTEQDFVKESRRLTDNRGPDYIIDGVGRDTFTKDLEAVASKGHIVLFGAASGPAEPLMPNSLQGRSITISGGSLYNHIITPEDYMKRASDVVAGLKQGWLKLNVEHVLPLKDAAKAHELLENRSTTGKVVLNCAD
jgi:NADPH2:quinone reductase